MGPGLVLVLSFLQYGKGHLMIHQLTQGAHARSTLIVESLKRSCFPANGTDQDQPLQGGGICAGPRFETLFLPTKQFGVVKLKMTCALPVNLFFLFVISDMLFALPFAVAPY